MRALAADSKLERLDINTCIDAYATNFQTQKRHLILVSNDTTYAWAPYHQVNYRMVLNHLNNNKPNPYDWMCGGLFGSFLSPDDRGTSCDKALIEKYGWKPMNITASYCLSETMLQKCSLRFSRLLAWIVIAFNVAKVLMIIYLPFWIKEDPLMTMGDAVSSFLKRCDHTTKFFCLMGKKGILQWSKAIAPPSEVTVTPYDESRQRWSTVLSRMRWTICILL